MPTTPRAYSHEARREAASRNLAEVLGPTPQYSLPVRPHHLDLVLGDSVNVSHPLGPWGEPAGRRRFMRVLTMKHRIMGFGLDLTLLDYKRLNSSRFAFNFEDAGELGGGMARVLPSSGFSFYRPTRAWADDPSGDGVRGYEEGFPRAQYLAAGRAGWLCERRAKQLLLRTSFGTGSMPAHTGAGSSSEDTTSVFNPGPNGLAGTFKRLIMTAGNPHSSDGVQPWPASRAAGTGALTLSLYHHDDAGATLSWMLQRASDSNYWNEGTRAWQVGSVNNAMASILTTPGLQVASRGITGAATTYTFSSVQASGGTASRVNRIHHVQLEEKGFESSPVPFGVSYSENCPGFRDDDYLALCNDSGVRVGLRERGTFLTRFVTRWSTADLSGLNAYLLSIEYDANNWVRLYFDGVTSTKDRLVLEVRAGGSTVTTAATVAVTRGVESKVGMRWASNTYDELGTEYATPAASKARYDVWFGTAIVFSVEATMPTETTEARVLAMCKDGGENIDGTVVDWGISKSVLAADEMAAAL